MACMNKREVVEDLVECVRQNPGIYDQSQAEHKDSVLLANIETSITEEFDKFILLKPVCPLSCTFHFCTVVEQAEGCCIFYQKLLLIVQVSLLKQKMPGRYCSQKWHQWNCYLVVGEIFLPHLAGKFHHQNLGLRNSSWSEGR